MSGGPRNFRVYRGLVHPVSCPGDGDGMGDLLLALDRATSQGGGGGKEQNS